MIFFPPEMSRRRSTVHGARYTADFSALPSEVIPAQAGIHSFLPFLDSRLRGNDERNVFFNILQVEPHGQEPVAPMLRRNPPKLQSSFAKASEDTRIPPRSGDRGFLRRRVKITVEFF